MRGMKLDLVRFRGSRWTLRATLRTTSLALSVASAPLLGAGCGGAEDASGEARASGALVAAPPAPPVIPFTVATDPLHAYDDAPRAPDADDPAIWVHPTQPGRSLFVGALKNSGMQVFDLAGRVVQTIVPPSRPGVSDLDPPAPGGPDPGTGACPESESGETFGRFNNVDIVYGFELSDDRDGGGKDGRGGGRGRGRRASADLAVVTDRGCDRVRVYAIDPDDAAGPLREITAPDAGRVFPERFAAPSPFQPGEQARGVHPNPLDDQSTNYGLAAYTPPGGGAPRVFVTQRHSTTVAELALVDLGDGHVAYRKVREYRFPSVFTLRAPSGRGTIQWAPCREDPNEDPQLEGMVVDQQEGVLYASQEVIGIWRIPLRPGLPAIVNVPQEQLIERTQSFGQAYWAIPDDDEFSCQVSGTGTPPAGTVVVAGNPAAGGADLVADVEGLTVYYAGRHGGGYVLASSQGDGSYHVYDRRDPRRHLATFRVEGTDHTDGHDVTNVRLGRAFPRGLFVTQNGEAPPPASEDPINGFEYDNSTQFELLDWGDIAGPLGLAIDAEGFDPRKP